MTFYGTTATAAGIVVPKKYLDAGRRRRLQQASDRRRPLQVRQPQAGRGGRAGGLSRLLAPRAERQDAGHEERARGDHARALMLKTRRGRHRLRARRPRRRGRPGATRACRSWRPSTPRSSGSSSPSSGTPSRRGTTSGCGWRSTYALDRKRINEAACLGFCPPAGVIVPRVMDFALQVEPPPYDPAEGQAAARRGRLSRTGFDAGEFAADPRLPDRGRGGGERPERGRHPGQDAADGARGLLRRLAGEEAARPVHDRGRQLRQRGQPRRGVHPVQGRLRLWRLSRHRRAVPAAGARARRRASARRCCTRSSSSRSTG